MKTFKISQLEAFSGIKAHTIRIWEKRYGVLKPLRSEGDIRLYPLSEVARLLDIALLSQNGYKISCLKSLSNEVLESTLESLDSQEAILQKAIKDLIILMYSSEIEEFEDVLDSCVKVAGIGKTMSDVIFPFLTRTHLLSYNDTSSDTHFVVTAIRKKIILAIELTDPSAMVDKKALLFLPESEHYDLLLLYVAYLLKVEGVRVLYLGTNISVSNLENIIDVKHPDILITYIAEKQKFKLNSFLPYLSQHLPQSTLYVITTTVDNREITGDGNTRFIHYETLREDLANHVLK